MGAASRGSRLWQHSLTAPPRTEKRASGVATALPRTGIALTARTTSRLFLLSALRALCVDPAFPPLQLRSTVAPTPSEFLGVINLLDILSPNCVRSPLTATTKRGVIEELVDLLAAAGKVTDAQSLKDAVWTREQTRTTGIGFGLAIPHGKCAGMPSLAMAIGKPAQPMNFDSIDGQPVKLIVLLASPPDKQSDHIQALARISRLMNMEEFRNKTYAAASSEELFELFRAQEGK